MTDRLHRWLLSAGVVVALLFTCIVAHAGGSVAPIPNRTLYGAYVVDGCPTQWASSPGASLAASMPCVIKLRGGVISAGQSDACWIRRELIVISDTQVRATDVQFNNGTGQNIKCPNDGVVASTNVWPVSYDTKTATACPDNSTGSPADSPTSCSCKLGYKPDAAGAACIADCTKGSTSSSGYYDIGPDATANPVVLGCRGTCQVVFGGTCPAGAALVGGVKHWFCKGSYFNTGEAGSCPSTTPDVVDGASTTPSDSCGPGQVKGQLNGKNICAAGGDGKQTEESKDKSTKKTETTTKTNEDGSTTKTDTTTEVDGNGNKRTTVTTTTTRSDGTVTSETTTTGKPSGTSSEGDDSEDPEKTECEKNPSGQGCGGEGADIGELYAKRDKTLDGVLTAGRDAFMASPVGSAVGGFLVVSSSAACPTWQGQIAYFNTSITIDQFCAPWALTALSIFKVALILVASFFAFRIAIE